MLRWRDVLTKCKFDICASPWHQRIFPIKIVTPWDAVATWELVNEGADYRLLLFVAASSAGTAAAVESVAPIHLRSLALCSPRSPFWRRSICWWSHLRPALQPTQTDLSKTRARPADGTHKCRTATNHRLPLFSRLLRVLQYNLLTQIPLRLILLRCRYIKL